MLTWTDIDGEKWAVVMCCPASELVEGVYFVDDGRVYLWQPGILGDNPHRFVMVVNPAS